MKDLIQKFIDDEGGLTVVEYALAGALVAAVVIGAFSALGTAVSDKIDFIGDEIAGAGASGDTE